MAIYNERNLKPFTDYIRDEAREEGRQEGRFSEKQELAKKLLADGFDVKKVAELTGLDLEK